MCNFSELETLLLEKGQIVCADIDEALMEYVEQNLSSTVTARIEEHIDSCKECQTGVKLYSEVIAIAGTLNSPFSELQEEKNPEASKLPKDVETRLYETLNAKLGLNMSIAR